MENFQKSILSYLRKLFSKDWNRHTICTQILEQFDRYIYWTLLIEYD